MHPSPPQVTRQGVAFRTKSAFHTETASFSSTPYFIVHLLILMGLSIIWIISTAELNPLFAQPLLWSIFHLHLCYRRRLIPMKCINQTSLLLSFQLNYPWEAPARDQRRRGERLASFCPWFPFQQFVSNCNLPSKAALPTATLLLTSSCPFRSKDKYQPSPHTVTALGSFLFPYLSTLAPLASL